MEERHYHRTLYFVDKEKLVTVVFRDGKYCIERKQIKKRIFSPMDPQPPFSQLLEVHGVYSILKASSDYKRCVTWFSNIPSSLSFVTQGVVLVEYIGQCP